MPNANNYWKVPRQFEGQTVICIGGGPSLTKADARYAVNKCPIIAINDAFRLVPECDALYVCDLKWWDWYYEETEFLKCPRITTCVKAKEKYPLLHLLDGKHEPGLSTVPDTLHYGANGGYQAINLAVLYGAKKIVLLGYDMRTIKGLSHWFGNHPDRAVSHYKRWIPGFKTMLPQLQSMGVEIVNCSPGSALDAFRLSNISAEV